jgi:prolyl 4-hydroxylase
MDGKPLEIETLCIQPLVFEVKNFLKNEECDYIIQQAEPAMTSSEVYQNDADVGKPATEWRTSTQTWLRSASDALIAQIDQRVEALTRVPIAHQEDVQVLRYLTSQKYNVHLDAFDPSLYANQVERLQMIDYGHKNRLATVFWYMTDVAEGGHTCFPRAGGTPHPPQNDTMFTTGLLVAPERGKVIIFYSLLPNGNIDPFSLHGGTPVGKGCLKRAANKWVWNKPV